MPLGGVLVARVGRRAVGGDPEFVLRHGYTYSGHPAGCVAALAGLDITEPEGLVDRAGRSAAAPAGLASLHTDGLVEEVRGEGAVWAVWCPGASTRGRPHRVLDLGVVVRPIAPSTLAMCPPLIISDEDLEGCRPRCAPASAPELPLTRLLARRAGDRLGRPGWPVLAVTRLPTAALLMALLAAGLADEGRDHADSVGPPPSRS